MDAAGLAGSALPARDRPRRKSRRAALGADKPATKKPTAAAAGAAQLVAAAAWAARLLLPRPSPPPPPEPAVFSFAATNPQAKTAPSSSLQSSRLRRRVVGVATVGAAEAKVAATAAAVVPPPPPPSGNNNNPFQPTTTTTVLSSPLPSSLVFNAAGSPKPSVAATSAPAPVPKSAAAVALPPPPANADADAAAAAAAAASAALVRKLKASQTSLWEARNSLEDSNAKVSRLSGELVRVRRLLEAERGAARQTAEAKAELVRRLVKFTADNAELKCVVEDLSGTIDQRKDDLDSALKELEQAKDANADLARRLDASEAARAALSRQFQESEAQRAKLAERVQALECRVKEDDDDDENEELRCTLERWLAQAAQKDAADDKNNKKNTAADDDDDGGIRITWRVRKAPKEQPPPPPPPPSFTALLPLPPFITLSRDNPSLFLAEGVIDADTCAALLREALKPGSLKPSVVDDPATGGTRTDTNSRSSTSRTLKACESAAAGRALEAMAQLARAAAAAWAAAVDGSAPRVVPEGDAELILYSAGQGFTPHWDHADGNPRCDRAITVLLYLNGGGGGGGAGETGEGAPAPLVGGATLFPNVAAGGDDKALLPEGVEWRRAEGDGSGSGGRAVLAVAPRAARALVWRNQQADGKLDAHSEHAGEAVKSGSKACVTCFYKLLA